LFLLTVERFSSGRMSEMENQNSRFVLILEFFRHPFLIEDKVDYEEQARIETLLHYRRVGSFLDAPEHYLLVSRSSNV
jgi:hypothetical protein